MHRIDELCVGKRRASSAIELQMFSKPSPKFSLPVACNQDHSRRPVGASGPGLQLSWKTVDYRRTRVHLLEREKERVDHLCYL